MSCVFTWVLLKSTLLQLILLNIIINESLDISIIQWWQKESGPPIKSTENLNMTCKHCKRLVTTPTDVFVYSQSYEKALRILLY